MTLLTLADISLSFGGRQVLERVNLQIRRGERTTIAGANGSGKTTLMKVISGELEADEGVRSVAPGVEVSYLPQIGIVHRGRSLYEEVEDAFTGARELVTEREAIGELLERAEELSPGRREQLLHRHQEIYESLEEQRYYSRDQEIRAVVGGLGFFEEDLSRDCSEFSGGRQMRIALAKRLLQRAEILLLDEPTNYLDLPAREWLQGFVASYPGAVLLVSHDREFLDETTNNVLEILSGRLKRYPMIYTRYEAVRDEEIAQQIKAYEEQQAYIEKTEEFIRRFRYNAAKAKQVQSRVKELDRTERLKLPEHMARVALRIPSPPHSGREVLRLREIRRSYGERTVLEGIDLDVERGAKVALIGRNGAGKSTLMRIIAGRDRHYQGERVEGSGVIPAWFPQNAGEQLSPGRTILDEVSDGLPTELIPKVRDTLGAFLFPGDEVFKPVEVLSGGERSRVALVKLLLRPANLLLLDEPTNHLDMSSKDILCEALEQYEGTLVFVSHDREFLRTLATSVVELSPPEATAHHRPSSWVVPGGYEYYLRQRERREEPSPTAPESPRERAAAESHQEQKRRKNELRRLERREEELVLAVEEQEEELERIRHALALPENYTDHRKAAELDEAMSRAEACKERLMEEWEELHRELETLEAEGGRRE
ncbi:MAG: ABC-F family ATP-binding cassette domain-containing protein [Spirochaetaceae bacterium]